MKPHDSLYDNQIGVLSLEFVNIELIRHYTLDKTQVHEDIAAIIARDVLESTQNTMLHERKEAYITTKFSV